MEALLAHLLLRLSVPLDDPLAPEVILVQNPGMARWLSQRMALEQGIAANVEFPLPATFIWQVQQAWLGGESQTGAFDRQTLHWRLMGLLPDALTQAELSPLARYLSAEGGRELRQYQLCGRLAALFDQYLVYRPEMLLAWEQGKRLGLGDDESWQAWLWRALVASTQGEHRAQRLVRFLDRCSQPPSGPIPKRVSLFGLSALAPVQLQVLSALSVHVEVCLYLLNPCQGYWADIEDERGQARRRARWRLSGQTDHLSALMDVGNPLLASMGQTGQMLVDQLLTLDAESDDCFVEVPAENLLTTLQRDILHLHEGRLPLAERPIWKPGQDVSLQIHACHSRLREVQVLHDQLRRCFDEMPGLEPRELVVMAPEMADYAPYVEAVFGAARGERHIPWSLADQSLADLPLLQAVDRLLRLPDARFEASWLMGLLEVPALGRRFGIDDKGLEQIRLWVDETAIRWGLDGQMRADLDLPPSDANTWDAGLQRLLLGYALPQGTGLYQGRLVYDDIEGSEAELLGQLAQCLSLLDRWRRTLTKPVTPAQWQSRINQLLGDFFQPDLEEQGALQSLRELLADWCQCCKQLDYAAALSLDLVRALLTEGLSDSASTGRFLAGGVTFCNMVPMRSIPFRVICLLGMNDGDYPRQDRPPSFDLLPQQPMLGDRSRRWDDRYLFLEALLSARERLYISYIGNSIRDNSRRLPSVLVTELLDALAQRYRLPDAGDFAEGFVVRHPLQPFSRRYFDGSDPRLFSYDRTWLDAAEAVNQPGSTPFFDQTLKAETSGPDRLDLSQWLRFLSNPSGWFLRQIQGIDLSEAGTMLCDEEPFALDTLGRYQLGSDLLASLLADEDLNQQRQWALASGELPQGHAGLLQYQAILADLPDLAARIRQRLTADPQRLELDIQLGDSHLNGWLSGVVANGLVRYRVADLKAKDRLRLWLQHLLMPLALPEGSEPQAAQHIARDRTLVLQSVDKPQALLQDFIDAWRQGQCRPLPLFPGPSLAYAEQWLMSDDRELALQAAEKNWAKDWDGGASAEVALAYRGLDPLRDTDFAEWAERLFCPLVAHSETLTAAKDLV